MPMRHIVLGFFLALLPGIAQGEGIDQAFENPKPGKEWNGLFGSIFKSGKSIAVIVAISEYKGGYNALPSAQPDAEKVRDFLLNSEGYDRVYVLTEDKVTKPRLEHLMVDILPPVISQSDRFLFYWSGHGDQWTNPTTHKTFGYLPLYDSPQGSYSTMISMDDIARWDQLLSARQTLFILDACLSGLAGVETKSGTRALTLEQLSRPARFLLTAGSATEQVIAGPRWHGSLFTDSFIQGAKGDAASTQFPDGVVGLYDLMGYLQRRVANEKQLANWSGSLTPQLNKLQSGDGEYFFLPSAIPQAPSSEQNPQSKQSPQAKGLQELGTSPLPAGALLVPQIAHLASAVGTIQGAAVSDDGSLLATAGGDGSVRIWNIPDRRLIRRMSTGCWETSAVAWSRGGDLLAGACGDGGIWIWEARLGRTVQHIATDRLATSLAFSSSGNFLVAGFRSANPNVIAYSIPEGRIQATFVLNETTDIYQVAFLPNKNAVLALGHQGIVETLELEAKRKGRQYRLPEGISSFGIQAAANRLIVGGNNGTLSSINIANGTQLWAKKISNSSLDRLSFSSAGAKLGVSGDSFWIMDPESGSVLKQLPDLGLAFFTPKDDLIDFVAGGVPSIRSVADGSAIGAFEVVRTSGKITGLWPGSQPGTVLAVRGDGSIGLWDLRSGVREDVFGYKDAFGRGVQDDRPAIRATPDGAIVIVGSLNFSLHRRADGGSGASVYYEKDKTGSATSIAISANGELVAAGGTLGAKVWTIDGKPIGMFPFYQGALTFTSNGKLLLTAEATLSVWSLENGKKVKEFGNLGGKYQAVVAARDNKTVVTAGEDGVVRIWDLDKGALKASLIGHIGSVYTLALTSDGRTAVSGGEDGIIRVWDVESGMLRWSLNHHTGPIRSIVLDERVNILAAASDDESVSIWSLSDGRYLASLYELGTQWAVVGADGRYRGSAPFGRLLAVVQGTHVLSPQLYFAESRDQKFLNLTQ